MKVNNDINSKQVKGVTCLPRLARKVPCKVVSSRQAVVTKTPSYHQSRLLYSINSRNPTGHLDLVRECLRRIGPASPSCEDTGAQARRRKIAKHGDIAVRKHDHGLAGQDELAWIRSERYHTPSFHEKGRYQTVKFLLLPCS